MTGPLRKTCLNCGAEMPKSLSTAEGALPTRSASITQLDPEGVFCRLRCAAAYGVRVAREVRVALANHWLRRIDADDEEAGR